MIIQFYALSCFATKKKLPIATVMPWILNAMQMTASYYLKMNRIEYYDRMTQVRRTGDYEQWVTFSFRLSQTLPKMPFAPLISLLHCTIKVSQCLTLSPKGSAQAFSKCSHIWNQTRLSTSKRQQHTLECLIIQYPK